MAVYAQFGCGLSTPEGWLNFDASPTLRLQKLPLLGPLVSRTFPTNALYGDIIKGLPLKNDSVDAVYCSHVLEHLSLEDCRKALVNTHKVLRHGGVFRMVLPSLATHITSYMNCPDREQAAMNFMKHTILGQERRPRGLRGLILTAFGNAAHRWMWDFPSLAAELRKTGFTSIREAVQGDSGDAMFDRVESPERWKWNPLGIHCLKA